MHHVLTEAERLGARRATLEVRSGNAGALRLYERLGFYVAWDAAKLTTPIPSKMR